METPAALLVPDWLRAGTERHVVDLGPEFTLCGHVQYPTSRAESQAGFALSVTEGAVVVVLVHEQHEEAKDAKEAKSKGKEKEKEREPEQRVVLSGAKREDGWRRLSLRWRGGRLEVFVDGEKEGEAELQESLHICEMRDAAMYGALSDAQCQGLISDSRVLSTGLELRLLPSELTAFWEEGRERLCAAMALGHTFQDQVRLDLFVALLHEAKRLFLAPAKTCVVVSIMVRVLAAMGDEADCFREYKRLMMLHARERGCTALRAPEARQLTDFVSSRFFRHFLLYRYVLVKPQECVTKSVGLVVKQPLPPPELSTGLLAQAAAPQAVPEVEEVPEPKAEEDLDTLIGRAQSAAVEQVQSSITRRDKTFFPSAPCA